MKANNPYVGPRAFEEQDSRNFFGRSEETRQMASLVIARRVVLLHAPSGAGKTSLLSAGLIPYLKQRKKINILPIARVGGDLPPDVDGREVQNIYVFNTLLDLAGEDTQPGDLLERTLSEELAGSFLPQPGQRRARPGLLILDQFEELFTTHPDRYPERADFFFQLQMSLQEQPQLSLLLSMREDYIALLDSYAAQMPDRLRTRFRLELLGEEAACQAVQQPARQTDMDFRDAAVAKLVNDLRKVQVQQPDGSPKEQLGRYIEPVQLQVVCRRLWGRLPAEATRIEEADVEAVGDVDTALADYYADRVQTTARQSGVRERAIREWFDRQLITEQGLRGQVLKGPQQSQGLDNRAISPLVDTHLVRSEKRLNATWYELSHNRLIEPVRSNNARWFQAHLSPLQRQAALWQEQRRSQGLLLRDEALVDAETWAVEHQDELIPVEKEFLAACREVRDRMRRERRKNRFIQGLAVVATICLGVAIYFFVQTNTQRKEAERRSFVSIAQSLIAYAFLYNMEDDRERAALLARQAYFLNQRYQGDVIEEIDKTLRTILHPVGSMDTGTLVEQVCQKVKFEVTLTSEQWEGFVGPDIPYEPCPEPREPDKTPRIHLRSEGMTANDALALSLNLYEESGRWYTKQDVDNEFEDQGEVVVDHTTGLMWQKSGSEEVLTYEEAQEYVKELNRQNFAGYSDWRLPTIPELMSSLEPESLWHGYQIFRIQGGFKDLRDMSIFDMGEGNKKLWSQWWSADKRRRGNDDEDYPLRSVWFADFDDGSVHWTYLDVGYINNRFTYVGRYFIRCVRSRQ